jgi:ABC-type transport system involved in multi-copper enzyme maturation permease subunit
MLAVSSFPAYLSLALLFVIAVVAGAILVGLTAGMVEARSLVRREFAAYFVSPIAYVVFFVFLAVTGGLFWVTFGLLTTTGPKGTEWPMQTMFADERFWLVFLFIPPLLTMRLFAEERSSGTLEPLMTAPLRDWQVVLGKYLACLGFYVVLWLPTLVYLPALQGAKAVIVEPAFTAYSVLMLAGLAAFLVGAVMLIPRLGTPGRLVSLALVFVGAGLAVAFGLLHYHLDDKHLLEVPALLDPAPVLSTYLGMFLAGAMFLAIGLLVSSLVRDQMVAALVSLGLGLVFIVAGFLRPEPGSGLYQFAYFFSVPLHFERTFTRGVIDTRPLVLYASLTLFCLFLTVRSLESRRWQ